MKERRCVIVDAYSTGRYLPEEFKRYGIKTVHAMSSARIPPIFQSHFNAEIYDEVLRPGERMSDEEVVQFHLEALRARELEFIIAGCESGVELADSLSELLGLPSNGTALSAARRDKSRMSDALTSAGVRSIRQVVSDNADEVTSWMRQQGFDEIVVKPLNSAGTEDVFFCSTDADVRRAVNVIVGKTNCLGAMNRFALGQEKINGQQYTVNAISADGETFVTEVWTYDTVPVKGAGSVCSVEQLLGGKEPVVQELSDYLVQALKALEIVNGPAHAEIIVDRKGPVLVDCGARLQGTMSAKARTMALGHNHITLTAWRYADPVGFTEYMRGRGPYRRQAHALCVSLISDMHGVVNGYPGLEAIRKLPSFADAIAFVPIGQNLVPTTDLASTPGIVYLVNNNLTELDDDHRKLRAMRMDQVFELKAQGRA
ncbi:ATP-grasp domain-containing protein [Bradyrhizobium yuanmingense]|uniref:ATP-grasp domain-containing protein n=1 Tax=Bradyrhizobium yuanmingense TaxID=108015 RepID=UPI0023B8C174|nr:ATP-grasp domain-containing protein [Bradyrhizobium yuanmingense]MDF0516661.1 ATP-grasp domain-containing protein [Bradyrhizobium yuanmingense]